MSVNKTIDAMVKDIEELVNATEKRVYDIAMRVLELPMESKQESVVSLLGAMEVIRSTTADFRNACKKVQEDLSNESNTN